MTRDRTKRSSEMIRVAYYFGRYDASQGQSDSTVPPELRRLGIRFRTQAIELFRARIGEGRSKETFKNSMDGDIRAIASQLRAGTALYDSRYAAIGNLITASTAEVWSAIEGYIDLDSSDNDTDTGSAHSKNADILEDLKAHADEYESSTEKESIIKARLGQGKFKKRLEDRWTKRCAVTSCKEARILRASHIKPWRMCNNQERLDVDNGFLLIPNLDSLFDVGLISFDDGGDLLISTELSVVSRVILGVATHMRLTKIYPGNLKYLAFHRKLHGFKSC